MKRILSFLTIVLCSVTMMYSQVTLTKATHGFVSDDKHETVAVDYQNPGEGGQNLVWDFSQIIVPEGSTTAYLSYMENSLDEGNIAANRNDNITFFFNITDKGNEYMGYEAETQKLVLTTPMVKTLYPQFYGKHFEGEYTGEMINKTSEGTTPVNGTYSTHADATGTLLLPEGKSFETLRVHTTETMVYRNYTYVTDKYLWYAQNVKYPLFVTINNYIEAPDGKVYSDSKKSYLNTNPALAPQNPTNIRTISNDVACKVSPNPFVNTVDVSYYLPEATKVNIELYSATGAKITTLLSNETQSGQVNFSKNIGSMTNKAEVYILKLTFGDKVQSIKLVKSAK